VNQVECGAHFRQDALLAVCEKHGVVMQAYGPLGRVVKVDRIETPVENEALMVSALETIIRSTSFEFCFQFQLAPLQLGSGDQFSADGRTWQMLPVTSSTRSIDSHTKGRFRYIAWVK